MSVPPATRQPTETPLQQTLVLSNALLRASLTIGPLEWRLFEAMLARIPREAAAFEEVAIPLRELFPGLAGRLSKVEYQQLESACNRLAGRIVELQPVSGPAELEAGTALRDFQKIPLLSNVYRRVQTGRVYARFNEWLKPYLLGLTRDFTQAPAAELRQLRSAHAHCLYWLLRQHQEHGRLTLAVPQLKWQLGLQDSYQQFPLFERRVLQQARRELAATTMAFAYQVLRQPGQATLVRFDFQPARISAEAAAAEPVLVAPPRQHR